MRRKKVVSTVNLSICASFLQVNGHQIMAFLCPAGALKTPRKVNGYGADYAILMAQNFVNTISVIIEEGKRIEIPKSQEQQALPNNISVADEIKKLANLRDEGILTQEEFEKQKTLLLS